MSVEEAIRSRVMSVLAAEHGSGVRGAAIRRRAGGVLMGGVKPQGLRHCTQRRINEHGRLKCYGYADGPAPRGFVPVGPKPKPRGARPGPRKPRPTKGVRRCVEYYTSGKKKNKCKQYSRYGLADVYPDAPVRLTDADIDELLGNGVMGGAAASASEHLRDAAHMLAAKRGVPARIAEFMADLVARAGRYFGGVAGGRRMRIKPAIARKMRSYPRGSGVLMSGGASSYVKFLKKYAKQHNMSYKDAMIQVKRKKLWRGGGVNDFY